MSIAIHVNEFWKGYLYAIGCVIVVQVGWGSFKYWRKQP